VRQLVIKVLNSLLLYRISIHIDTDTRVSQISRVWTPVLRFTQSQTLIYIQIGVWRNFLSLSFTSVPRIHIYAVCREELGYPVRRRAVCKQVCNEKKWKRINKRHTPESHNVLPTSHKLDKNGKFFLYVYIFILFSERCHRQTRGQGSFYQSTEYNSTVEFTVETDNNDPQL